MEQARSDMDRVMILGNGLSRLLHFQQIEEWNGEIWACNYAFTEPLAKKITRLTGHVEVMHEAEKYKKDNGLTYEIWGGHLGAILENWKRFTCPGDFCKDSGTTLVAQALHEKRERIVCVGFDMGGKDIHSPDLDRQDKTVWVKRWRRIASFYGLDRVEFLGDDHHAFLLGCADAKEFARQYIAGRPHLKSEEYRELYWKFTGSVKKEPKTLMRVRHLKGDSIGTIVTMWSDIATVMASREEVAILGQEPKGVTV